ncbi:hypothetical protein CHELA1G11_70019 [Hyphomicrobiales bacterium]|nr:hypothetical protein CHELA1G11_70019 [Hyphomicrobiales bacterium]
MRAMGHSPLSGDESPYLISEALERQLRSLWLFRPCSALSLRKSLPNLCETRSTIPPSGANEVKSRNVVDAHPYG